MREFNSIFISTVPRTGSMWTNNVTREIFNLKKFKALPISQLTSDEEWLNYYQHNVLFDNTQSNRYVLKIHGKLTKTPPRSKIVTTIRNPYDLCASYHQFMKSDLAKSITVAESIISFLDHYKNLSSEILIIKYEDIETQPEKLIKKLASYCELSLSDDEISLICNKYKKKEIKKIIDNNDLNAKQYDISKNNEFKVLHLKDGKKRTFDLKTGFQTGHISNRKTGEWRKVFSSQETQMIIQKLDKIAVELGYFSEKN